MTKAQQTCVEELIFDAEFHLDNAHGEYLEAGVTSETGRHSTLAHLEKAMYALSIACGILRKP